jgi:hypothetical protein
MEHEHPLDASIAARFASFLCAESARSQWAVGGGLQLTFADPTSAERPEFERFVSEAFERRHEAVVRTFMPVLAGCRNRERRLCTVVGLRNATSDALFLERYLDRPVHEAIGNATGRPVRREQLVEIGNLAGGNCRAALRLVAALPYLLLAMRFEWVVFTATSTVRGMLATLGAPLVELARAGEACAAGGVDRWGRYYRNDPRVCAGWLPLAREIPAFASRAHGR